MLILRASKAERILRSTGDPPNGIVLVAQPPDHSFAFAVSPSLMPEDQVKGVNISFGHIPDDLAFLETEEAVGACVGDEECRCLYSLATGPIFAMVPSWIHAAKFEAVHAAVDFLEELHQALWERATSE